MSLWCPLRKIKDSEHWILDIYALLDQLHTTARLNLASHEACVLFSSACTLFTLMYQVYVLQSLTMTIFVYSVYTLLSYSEVNTFSVSPLTLWTGALLVS